ncbi:MAG: S53 family peptidase [Solirubrobacteraceae bacterium]
MAAIAMLLTVMAGGAMASASLSGSKAAVSQGINPAKLPGVKPFGKTPAKTPEQVSFVLRERNLPQLEYTAQHGITHYQSVNQFADTYGQSSSVTEQLTSYLASFGIKSTVYPDRVDVSTTGTAGEYNKALSVKQQQYRVPALSGSGGQRSVRAQTIHGTAQSPQLPYPIAHTVLAILGLTNYGPFTSQAVHVDTKLTHPQQGSSNSCVALTGLPDACNLPADFASNYHLDGLYARGAEGQGQTLAIVTLAALDPGAPQYFWKNIAKIPSSNRTLTVDNVDGGPGAPSDASGSGETDLDVEQSGALAPDANVIVYQSPNTDAGFADSYFMAASQNTASSVSASWAESETYIEDAVAAGTETPAYEAAFDEAFLELAAQGQSGFTASGDWAAYTAAIDLGTTNLSVAASGDSPYITAAGGTTLPWSGTLTGPGGSANVSVASQRIWGWDYLWKAMAKTTPESLTKAAEANVTGSGGGFSDFEPEPSYQQGVPGTSSFSAVPYLTPTDYQNINGLFLPTKWNFDPTPPTIQGSGSHRADPDVSADADPFTGYLLYEPSFAGVKQPILQGGWGGTSFVAPQFNGSTAVIDSALGRRVGLWNPGLYSFATSANSPVTPLNTRGTSNDNIYYTGTPGTLFNEGAGLGIPNLTKLADDFGS